MLRGVPDARGGGGAHHHVRHPRRQLRLARRTRLPAQPGHLRRLGRRAAAERQADAVQVEAACVVRLQRRPVCAETTPR